MAQTITDLGFVGGKHLYHLKVTDLELDADGGTVINMPCDQIQAIIPTSSSVENTDGHVLSNSFTVSGNVLTITVKKMQVSGTNTWVAAETGDVSESVYDVLVLGL